MDRESFEQYADEIQRGLEEDGSGLYIAGALSSVVYLVSSKSAADGLHKHIGGCFVAPSKKWSAEPLRDRLVVILSRNRPAAEKIAAVLHGTAKAIRLVDLPEDVNTMITERPPAEAGELLVGLARSASEWEPKPQPEGKQSTPPPVLDTITAADLQKKDIPPIKFIVEKLIPVGLSILASPPKYGKSWMVLNLCLAVAMGERFLGYTANECECLYMALEDSQRRLKGRMNKLLAGKDAPAGFHFATTSHDMDNGLFDQMEDFLRKHPGTGLIVIDTLQRVRGAAHGKEGAYAADYREVGALKAFADKHNVAVLLVHHLRKMKDDGDPFNMISGTNGILGAADTTMVLTKEKRGDANATFSVIGRDIESSDTILRFNKETCYWENLGDADWFTEQQARLEYQESPIVKTVKKLLEQSPAGWSGTAQQLLDTGRFIARVPLADSTRALTNKLKGLDRLLLENDNIAHERKTNGSGGGKHKFYFANAPQFEEVEQSEINPFLEG